MKKCSQCQTLKNISEFGTNKAKSDGLQNQCKPCRKQINHKYYMANPKREERSEAGKRLRRKNKAIVYKYLASRCCIDCGLDDWRVLEFDHIENNKTANIASLMQSASSKNMLAEIEKCEIRCRNCHTLKTYERSLSWRYTYSQASLV